MIENFRTDFVGSTIVFAETGKLGTVSDETHCWPLNQWALAINKMRHGGMFDARAEISVLSAALGTLDKSLCDNTKPIAVTMINDRGIFRAKFVVSKINLDIVGHDTTVTGELTIAVGRKGTKGDRDDAVVSVFCVKCGEPATQIDRKAKTFLCDSCGGPEKPKAGNLVELLTT